MCWFLLWPKGTLFCERGLRLGITKQTPSKQLFILQLSEIWNILSKTSHSVHALVVVKMIIIIIIKFQVCNYKIIVSIIIYNLRTSFFGENLEQGSDVAGRQLISHLILLNFPLKILYCFHCTFYFKDYSRTLKILVFFLWQEQWGCVGQLGC